MKHISRDNYFESLDGTRAPHHDSYYSMYSTLLDGVVTDPLLMQIPVDDHLVHRGDGVFETFKCIKGAIYNLAAHLDRFDKSAAMLDFHRPWSRKETEVMILQTVAAANRDDVSVRLMLSRGPGSFGVNPYDCVGCQLYITTSELKRGFMESHPEGAVLGVSKVAAKLSFFARVKNCNYLPNVLMKKEAVDSGLDYVAGFDSRGMLTEGPTENIGIVTGDGILAFPKLDGILCGTTMMRVIELAKEHRQNLGLSGVELRDISLDQMYAADEILVVGTTPDVTSVRKFDGRNLDEAPGPVGSGLCGLLIKDQESNDELRTEVKRS